MNSTEIKKNVSAFTVPAGAGGLLGIALVAFGAVRIVGRLWAHLELRLLAVPGLAAVAVVVVGALLLTASLRVLSRRPSGSAAAAGR
ncbi:hypothetical protein [Streptomyces violaceorubidus]